MQLNFDVYVDVDVEYYQHLHWLGQARLNQLGLSQLRNVIIEIVDGLPRIPGNDQVREMPISNLQCCN